jgi:hypothetical protein
MNLARETTAQPTHQLFSIADDTGLTLAHCRRRN